MADEYYGDTGKQAFLGCCFTLSDDKRQSILSRQKLGPNARKLAVMRAILSALSVVVGRPHIQNHAFALRFSIGLLLRIGVAALLVFASVGHGHLGIDRKSTRLNSSHLG